MKSFFRFTFILFVFISCERITPNRHRSTADDLSERDISLLPGECLVSNELTCTYCNQSNYAKTYLFQFAINLLFHSEKIFRLLLEQFIEVCYQLYIRNYLEAPLHASHVDVQYPMVKVKTMSPTAMDMTAEMDWCCQARCITPAIICRVVRQRH